MNDEALDKLRAELETVRAERLVDEAKSAPSAIAALQQEIEDEKALRDACRKYGRIGVGVHAIYTEIGIVIVRRPTLAEFRMYQTTEGTAETKLEAMDSLVQSCIVHPGLVEFRKIEAAYPMIVSQLAGACSLLAGAALAITSKKS